MIRIGVFAVIALCGLPAVAQQSEKVLCEKVVRYTITPVSPDIPAAMQAYSGVWLGHWSYYTCTALIVQSIKEDGQVDGIYVWGRIIGSTDQGGSRKWGGKITNGVLKFANPKTKRAAEYKMVASGELKGVYETETFTLRGELKKQ